MQALTEATWKAVTEALASLDRDQAEVLFGLELMLDIAEAATSSAGVPYSGHALADAANALLQRRP